MLIIGPWIPCADLRRSVIRSRSLRAGGPHQIFTGAPAKWAAGPARDGKPPACAQSAACYGTAPRRSLPAVRPAPHAAPGRHRPLERAVPHPDRHGAPLRLLRQRHDPRAAVGRPDERPLRQLTPAVRMPRADHPSPLSASSGAASAPTPSSPARDLGAAPLATRRGRFPKFGNPAPGVSTRCLAALVTVAAQEAPSSARRRASSGLSSDAFFTSPRVRCFFARPTAFSSCPTALGVVTAWLVLLSTSPWACFCFGLPLARSSTAALRVVAVGCPFLFSDFAHASLTASSPLCRSTGTRSSTAALRVARWAARSSSRTSPTLRWQLPARCAGAPARGPDVPGARARSLWERLLHLGRGGQEVSMGGGVVPPPLHVVGEALIVRAPQFVVVDERQRGAGLSAEPVLRLANGEFRVVLRLADDAFEYGQALLRSSLVSGARKRRAAARSSGWSRWRSSSGKCC